MENNFPNDFIFTALSALQTGVPEKLLAAFQKEIGNDFNVTDVLNGWIVQPGYPVLHVNVTSDRQHIVLTQKRFLQTNPNHQDNTQWNVPITYASNRNNTDFIDTKPVNILSHNCLNINLKEPIDWIIFNVQQTGNSLFFLHTR